MSNSISPKKSLGQNFLTDKNIAARIVKLLGDIEDRVVVEIGPGMEVLTDILIDSKAKLTCVEIDSRAVEFLDKKYNDKQKSKLNIINTDVLKFDFAGFAENCKEKILVIGNIPYNISTEIFFSLFESSSYIGKSVLTVQREVAKRVVSQYGCKDYGITTLAAAATTSLAKIAFDISAGSFYPPPKVTSSVLVMEYDFNIGDIVSYNSFMKIVRAAFSQRRKVLKNALKSYCLSNNIDIELLGDLSKEYGSDFLMKRAEQLSYKDFLTLQEIINKIKIGSV